MPLDASARLTPAPGTSERRGRFGGGRGWLFRIPPNSFGFTLFLGAMSALTPLSIDMGLPAIPVLAASLGTDAAQAGLTLSFYVAGFALAQLLFGPLSDRFGRRWVLISGTAFFTLAAVASASSSSISAVIFWRFLQGAGGGASTSLCMAIVRDLFEGPAARARLSYVMMVLSVSPIVAPSVGALLLPLGGWRAIYAAMALAGAMVTLTALLGLEESNRAPDLAAMRPARLLANYGRALASAACLGNSLVGGLSMGCLFAYISGSPLVLLGVYHLSTRVYGLLFAVTSGGIMAGAWLAGRLATRVRGDVPVLWGLCIAAATSLALVGVTAFSTPPLAVLMPLLVANTFCLGLMASSVTHAAIEKLPRIAGVASAVVGCVRMIGAAASSATVAFLFPRLGLVALGVTMALFAWLSLAVWWFYARPASRVPVAA
jgi:DHA1 family bicyclomycin/chloramphenicol resistance-like MFS transporter